MRIRKYTNVRKLPFKIRKCRICGCTQNNACPGGCWWVEYDLCSSCADIDALDALRFVLTDPETVETHRMA